MQPKKTKIGHKLVNKSIKITTILTTTKN